MRRSVLYAIAVYFALTCTLSIYRAIQRFADPFPNWMVADGQWYDELLQAVVQAIGFAACIVFDVRRSRNMRRGITTSSKRWRDRPELRFFLFSCAALALLNIPIGAYKAHLAANDPSGAPWNITFWSAFPYGNFLAIPLVIALFIYDRRRLRREAPKEGTFCPSCGYDLRATPDRCPECGKIAEKAP